MAEERKIIRRNRPNELERIIRSLDKQSQKAIDSLAKLCQSSDEKIALDASKAILNMIADMKDQAEKRELQMLLTQHKIGTLGKPKDDENDIPLVDFNEIQSVE